MRIRYLAFYSKRQERWTTGGEALSSSSLSLSGMFVLRPPLLLFLLMTAAATSSYAGESAEYANDAVSIVLEEGMMKNVTHSAAILSKLAYEADPANVPASAGFDPSDLRDFESAVSLMDGPDQVLVASRHGYCYAAFRGTTGSLSDWYENFEIGLERVCGGDGDGGDGTDEEDGRQCCEFRDGYWKAFRNAAYFDDMAKALDSCVRSSPSLCYKNNNTDCVVMTGHSQGAGIASVAAAYFAVEFGYDPYMIGFGSVAGVRYPCPSVREDRWYLYTNALVGTGGEREQAVQYDIVMSMPPLGASYFGHVVVLYNGNNSDDDDEDDEDVRVAYLGMSDARNPFDFRKFTVDVHTIDLYYARVSKLIQSNRIQYPLVVEASATPATITGLFEDGRACAGDEECRSGLCHANPYDDGSEVGGGEGRQRDRRYVCAEKFKSCMTCCNSNECESGTCLWTFQCTNPATDLVQNGCRCYRDGQCESNRCAPFSGGCTDDDGDDEDDRERRRYGKNRRRVRGRVEN